MPDRVVRQFGYRQCSPAHPIRSQEARRPANNRIYVVRNLFVEALWLEVPSHLLMETWTSVPVIPPNASDPPMPPQALLDLIAREARRENVGKEQKFDKMLDLLTGHYRGS
ncbi:hypothetical protein M9H77_02657 [Catharanthus roseus]|uniref:Uncharacterized protein n=1 Tax=Catharanthus roseus TaxID=4058 RepID=A0ACC0C960_CATRO|nr:hypothetical protein M9H77_02657 [Catharanthus roseus]